MYPASAVFSGFFVDSVCALDIKGCTCALSCDRPCTRASLAFYRYNSLV